MKPSTTLHQLSMFWKSLATRTSLTHLSSCPSYRNITRYSILSWLRACSLFLVRPLTIFTDPCPVDFKTPEKEPGLINYLSWSFRHNENVELLWFSILREVDWDHLTLKEATGRIAAWTRLHSLQKKTKIPCRARLDGIVHRESSESPTGVVRASYTVRDSDFVTRHILQTCNNLSVPLLRISNWPCFYITTRPS